VHLLGLRRTRNDCVRSQHKGGRRRARAQTGANLRYNKSASRCILPIHRSIPALLAFQSHHYSAPVQFLLLSPCKSVLAETCYDGAMDPRACARARCLCLREHFCSGQMPSLPVHVWTVAMRLALEQRNGRACAALTQLTTGAMANSISCTYGLKAAAPATPARSSAAFFSPIMAAVRLCPVPATNGVK
jgi:hypothetical protein